MVKGIFFVIIFRIFGLGIVIIILLFVVIL